MQGEALSGGEGMWHKSRAGLGDASASPGFRRICNCQGDQVVSGFKNASVICIACVCKYIYIYIYLHRTSNPVMVFLVVECL